MTLRPTYEHHEGRIYEGRKAISDKLAAELLISHRMGAQRSRAMNWPKTAELSERFVTELEHAIRAAEIFNRVSRPSPDQERQHLASVKRTRKSARQAKGMTA